MSIFQALKKLVNPARSGEEAAERETATGEDTQPQAGDEPPRYRCNVCGHEADQGTYCPDCLADTMDYVGPPGQDGEQVEAPKPPSCQGCKKA